MKNRSSREAEEMIGTINALLFVTVTFDGVDIEACTIIEKLASAHVTHVIVACVLLL